MVTSNSCVILPPDEILYHHLSSRHETMREMSIKRTFVNPGKYAQTRLLLLRFEAVSLHFGKQVLLSLFLILETLLLHTFVCLFVCVFLTVPVARCKATLSGC